MWYIVFAFHIIYINSASLTSLIIITIFVLNVIMDTIKINIFFKIASTSLVNTFLI
jgi:hypothetical protein